MSFVLNVHGSAGPDCDVGRLRLAHAFVEALVDEVIDRGGGFAVFLSKEPRHNDIDLPIVFDWIVAERAYARCVEKGIQDIRIRIITGRPSKKPRIPAKRSALFKEICDHALGVIDAWIPDGKYAGEKFRKIASHAADGAVMLGGGKGVNMLHDTHGERLPTLPMDLDIGSACNEGCASLELLEGLLEAPERFFRYETSTVLTRLDALSLKAENANVVSIAKEVCSLFQPEIKARTEERDRLCGKDALRHTPRPLPPVILLAFANVDEQKPLRKLQHEEAGIKEILQPSKKLGRLEPEILWNATTDKIRDYFQNHDYHGRIRVLHFGGHANSDYIALMNAQGERTSASAAPLADYLGQQRGLSLVFLNGCKTANQVQRLRDAGIEAVISTSQPIQDGVAADFALNFYSELLLHPLRRAFELALNAIGFVADGGTRALVHDEDHEVTPHEPPWHLSCEDDDWRLLDPPAPPDPART